MSLQIETAAQDGVTVVTMAGEIDGTTAARAQEILVPLLEQHASLVLDVSAVSFLSSAGLRMLLLVYRQALAKNGKVALAGLNEQIRDTMAITGFLKFFLVCESVDAAVGQIGGSV